MIEAFIIFPIVLGILVYSAHRLLDSANAFGGAINVSPFIVGSFLVAFGTSLPEAAVALFSVFKGLDDVAVSLVVGSNIANIFLVTGIGAIIVRKITVTKNLIDIEIPLLLSTTALFILFAYDGSITFSESFLLLIAFIVYIFYIFKSEDNRSTVTTSRETLRGIWEIPKHISTILIYSVLIAVASHFVLSSTVSIASTFGVGEAIISITAIALGTSLPEIVVSISALIRKETEIVIGNVVGSNVFNVLFAIGIPGLFGTLILDPKTLLIGLPFLIVATLAFVISSISNKIHIWEGSIYLILYAGFIAKIIGVL